MKKILFICNVDWFFISHRLPIALEVAKSNFEVHVACKYTTFEKELISKGFKTHEIDIKRGKFSLYSDFITMFQIIKILIFIRPNIVHLITIKPIIFGGFILRFFKKVSVVFSFSGLGHTFVKEDFISKIRLFFIKNLYKFSLSNKRKHIIFQNNSDKIKIKNLKNIYESEISVIKGSGVNLIENSLKIIPNKPIIFMMASRLIIEKGVWEFVNASIMIQKKYKNIKFKLLGGIDIENPSSLLSKDIEKIKKVSKVEVYGFVKNIKNMLEKSHVIVLPSYYGEGVPKILIEACAIGRPIISTNIPGCKEAVINGKNGFIIKPQNSISLAKAIEKMILNQNKFKKMGEFSREIAIRKFDINFVIKRHMNIYKKLCQ